MKWLSPRYKNRFLLAFFACVVVMAMGKAAFSFVEGRNSNSARVPFDTVSLSLDTSAVLRSDSLCARKWQEPYHRIFSVSSFKNTFPDMNDVQLGAARKYGVSPVADRNEAEHRMKELVYVGADPYFHVDNLKSSVPYLVPRAAVLLHDIGRTFYDSLYIKGIPLHQIIVTSVLRTKKDVQKLRKGNGNATENSCHLYGTTVDICYNRYKTVEPPEGPKRRVVRNDSLKWVLSEVLRDFRARGRCFVKYEVKQGCFHLTVN